MNAQYNECMEHNLQWFDTDDIECPVCKLENELAALRARVGELERIEQAAKSLVDKWDGTDGSESGAGIFMEMLKLAALAKGKG